MLIIYAPHFVAGVVMKHGVVIAAAPRVKYIVGWTLDHVESYCVTKKWRCEDHNGKEEEHGIQ